MYQVKESSIHGKGLFSTRQIPEGELLGYCRAQETKEDGMYTLWVDEKGYHVSCNFRFINHSDQPNVAYYDDLSIVALKDIPIGEELLHDYNQ